MRIQFKYLLALLVILGLPTQPGEASTVSTFAATNYNSVYTGAPDQTDHKLDVPYSTDQIITGPIAQESVVTHEEPDLPGRADAKSDVQSVSDFGSFANLAILEGRGAFSASGGVLDIDIRRPDASVMEIPFTVSRMFAAATLGTRAAANFLVFVSDPDIDKNAPIVQQFTNIAIDEFGSRSLNSSFGFNLASLPSVATVTWQTAGGVPVTRNSVPAVDLPAFYGSLDISSLTVGKDYSLIYLWDISIFGKLGAGHFRDPLDLSGGMSLDRDVMARLTRTDINPPTAVPLPAGFLLLGTAFAVIGGIIVFRGKPIRT